MNKYFTYSVWQRPLIHHFSVYVTLAVPVCDAASAVSPAYISLYALSDTRSAPDEAAPHQQVHNKKNKAPHIRAGQLE